MNKILKLFLFGLLITLVSANVKACTEGTSGDEGSYCNTEEKPTTEGVIYRCVAMDGTTCKWTPTCTTGKIENSEGLCKNFAVANPDQDITHTCVDGSDGCNEEEITCLNIPKPFIGGEAACSSRRVSDAAFACVENEDSENKACKEVHLCAQVQKSEISSTVTCSDFPVSNSATHACVDKATTSTGDDKACEEKFLCTKATVTAGSNEECATYPKTFTNAICVSAGASETTCLQRFYCKSVTKDDLTEDSTIKCEDGLISSENEGSYKCIDETDTTKNTICQEVQIECEAASSGVTDDTLCKKLAWDKKDEQVCQKQSTDEKCVLVPYCDYAEGTSDAACAAYPKKVSTKICKKKSNENKCEEVAEATEDPTQTACADGSDETKCSSYQVTNSEIEKCVENPGGETKCKVDTLTCEEKESGTTDDICEKRSWNDKDNYLCKTNGEKCLLIHYCEGATPDADTVCANFPLKGTGTICQKKDGQNLCEEVSPSTDTTCSTATTAPEGGCSTLTIVGNDGTKECVANTDKTVGAKPCVVKDLTCAEKLTGATADICKLFTVDENHICQKHSTEAKCELIPYCNYAEGTSDEACAAYPKKVSTKICKKKSAENKCEEVAETSPDPSQILCENAEAGEDDDACGLFKLTDSNIKKCVHNDAEGAKKPCIEKTIDCEEKIKDATVQICEQLAVENKEQELCRKHTTEDKCILLTYCEFGEGESDEECGGYVLKDENKVCKKKSDENKCEEVVETDIQKICKSSTTATKDEECAVLKINDNDGTKKCVKDTTEGASTSCKEEIMECEEKTDGATEAICGKLKVKLEDEQKCQVTEDQKCELVDYCEYATLEDGDDCANYPVKNSNNECKKKDDENECQEVAKQSKSAGSLIKTSISLLLLFALI